MKLGKVSELIGVVIVEIKLQFLLLSVITFIFFVTISLEKIIFNRGKKTKKKKQ